MRLAMQKIWTGQDICCYKSPMPLFLIKLFLQQKCATNKFGARLQSPNAHRLQRKKCRTFLTSKTTEHFISTIFSITHEIHHMDIIVHRCSLIHPPVKHEGNANKFRR